MMLGGYVPQADLNRIAPAAIAEEFVSMLTPVAKIIMEQSLNIDLFRSIPKQMWVEIDEGIDKEMWGAKWDARVQNIMKSIPMANVIDRYNPFEVFGTTKEPDLETGFVRRRNDPNAFQRHTQFWTGLRMYSRDLAKRRIVFEAQFRKQVSTQNKHIRLAQRSKDKVAELQAKANLLGIQVRRNALRRELNVWLPKLNTKHVDKLVRAMDKEQ